MKEGTSLDLGSLITVTSSRNQHEEHDQEMQVDPQSPRDLVPRQHVTDEEHGVDIPDPSLPTDGSVQ